MATDLAQPKAPSASRHEILVEQQLDRARRRIRNLDALSSVLILLLGVLGYALGMAALDRAFTLSAGVRVAAFLAAGLAVLLYLGAIAWRLFQWRVNPYYAARRLEAILPDAKNSLINWLDLRAAPMPPVIRANLGRRAAKDVGEVDLDLAVSARRPAWLAVALAGLFLVLFVWFLVGPGQLTSLLVRAFAPFEKTRIATTTRITLLTPPGGDAVVPLRQDIQIRVQVEGRVPRVNAPDALKLHYRYRQGDPYIVRPLAEDADNQWVRTVVADDVQTGFWYKVTGGDFASREYQITVRAQPRVTRFDLTYQYPAYLRWADVEVRCGPTEVVPRPDIVQKRGTRVTLIARTNRPWHAGRLTLQEGAASRELPGEPIADDPEARRFQFVLDRSGFFQVQFTSKEGEPNVDRGKYRIEVIRDTDPVVVLTEPGKHIELVANGTLKLKGSAVDDHGIKGMTLRLAQKHPEQAVLQPKPYRPDVSFKLADGTYPQELQYQDFVPLAQLKTAAGKPFAAAPGMVLEYWLEATDNCDFPEAGGNVGKSKKFEVKIAAADKDQKQQDQQRQQAEKEQKQHEQQQDRKQQQRNKDAAQREQDKGKTQEQRDKEREQQRKDFQDKAQQLKDQLDKQKQEQNQKGQGKGDGQSEPKGQEKEKGSEQGSQGAGNARDQDKQPKDGEAGQKKDNAGSKQGDQGQAKGAGKPGQAAKQEQGQEGTAKNEGQPDAKGGPQGTAKNDGSKDGQPQQAQTRPKDGPKDGPGAGKAHDAGKDDQRTDAAQAKGNGDEKGSQQQQAPGQVRGQQDTGPKGATKEPGNQQGGTDTAQAKTGDPNQAKGGGQAEGKRASPDQAQQAGAGKGERGGDEKQTADAGRPKATADDVAKLEKQLQRPEQREGAAQELDRIRRQAQDPNVQRAADKALKDAGESERNETGKARPEQKPGSQVAKTQPKDSARGPKSDAGEAKGGGDKQVKDDAGKGKGDGGGKQVADGKGTTKRGTRPSSGTPGQGSSGFQDEVNPNPVDADAARRAGDLQLEDLRKKLTPEMLGKLNWSKKDAERFLAEARSYQQWLRRQERRAADADPPQPAKGPGQLGSVAPRAVNQGPGATRDPLDLGQALPPPEFRRAQQNFTGKTRD